MLEVLVLVDADVLDDDDVLVDDEVLAVDELLDVLDELELLLEVDVLLVLVVVWHVFVQSSLLFELPSSQASPEDIWTMPSPQMVHGFGSFGARQSLPAASAAGQPICMPSEPQGRPLPSLGQH